MSSTLKWVNGLPEIQPLTTVEEVLAWQPSDEERRFCRPVQPLPQRRDGGLTAARPRLLACHDMRGGYLEDRFLQGGGDGEGYTFRHWHSIDGFVYFSHRFCTVPPPGWINAAHLHGVPVLGTLITEWKEGSAACAALLASDATAEHAAHQLAELAEFIGFEGWVINIENEVAPDLIPRLLHFLRCLTKAMHSAVPGSTVIWYDAVTVQGKLLWQNALTEENAPFLDACDGLWVNYAWTQATPAQVRAAAGTRGWDVYLGIDVFGRGTYGGGQMACNVALAAAKEAELSVAMFAIAWPYERQEIGAVAEELEERGANTTISSGGSPAYPSWQHRDTEFWKLVVKAWALRRATLCSLPAFTDFSVGAGRALAQAGQPLLPAAFYNLSLLSLQASLAFVGQRPRRLRASLSSAAALQGGNSVSLAGEVAAPATLRLFRAAAPVPREGLRARVTAAVGTGVELTLVLRLRPLVSDGGADNDDDNPLAKFPAQELVLELGNPKSSSSNNNSSRSSTPGHLFKVASRATTLPFAWLPGQEQAGAGLPRAVLPVEWATWDFAVGPADVPSWDLSACALASVDIRVAPRVAGAVCPCQAYVGAVAVWEMDRAPPPCAPVMALQASDLKVESFAGAGGRVMEALWMRLWWEQQPWIQHCHVYIKVATAGEQQQPRQGGEKEKEELAATATTSVTARQVPPVWDNGTFVGVATCSGYSLAGFVLPERAVRVRLYVASASWTSVQTLREAAFVTVNLVAFEPPGPLG